MKTYAYAQDDRPTGTTYTGAVNPTPNVSFTWDPYFPRRIDDRRQRFCHEMKSGTPRAGPLLL